MRPDSLLTAVVTIVTSSGFLATVTTLVGVIVKARQGQKIREPARRRQLADEAATTSIDDPERRRADAAEAALDHERTLRRTWQDTAHEMRRYCIDHGTPLARIPPFPDDHPAPGGTP
jgi:hypothetical protein